MRRAVKSLAIAALVSSLATSCQKRQNGPAFQVEDLALGAAHACAVMKDGSLRCWGKNDAGQLGDGTLENRLRPVQLPPSPVPVSEVFAGGNTTCVLLEDGHVRCWGGPDALTATPSALQDVAQIVLAPTFGCARFKSDTLACWGDLPAPSSPLPPVLMLAAGEHHVCAVLKEDGAVRCWGKNESGQLGDGTAVDRPAPAAVSNLRGAIHIAAGAAHTCATLIDRTVSCWGNNRFGQVGDGTQVDRHVPTAIAGLQSVRATALGDGHSCARLYDGSVRCWGRNDAGQQDDGTHTDRSSPGMISGLFDVQQITAGVGTVCVRLAGSGALVGPAKPAVRCWGRNDAGQAGDGSRDERPVPVTVRW